MYLSIGAFAAHQESLVSCDGLAGVGENPIDDVAIGRRHQFHGPSASAATAFGLPLGGKRSWSAAAGSSAASSGTGKMPL